MTDLEGLPECGFLMAILIGQQMLLFLSTNNVQAVNCPSRTFPAGDLYSGDFFKNKFKFEREDAFLFLTSVLDVHQLK